MQNYAKLSGMRNVHPQEECKYTDAKSQQCNMQSNSEDDCGYFEVQNRHEHMFCIFNT